VNQEPEAIAILGYLGKITLLKHYGVVREIDAHPFYAKERLSVQQGTSPSISHEVIPDIHARGALVGGYAWAQTAQRHTKIVVLHRADIDLIRVEHSDEWAGGDLDEIARWYVPKTCVHALEKQLMIPQRIRARLRDDTEPTLDEAEGIVLDLSFAQKRSGSTISDPCRFAERDAEWRDGAAWRMMSRGEFLPELLQQVEREAAVRAAGPEALAARGCSDQALGSEGRVPRLLL
jgi:hypothetical protein